MAITIFYWITSFYKKTEWSSVLLEGNCMHTTLVLALSGVCASACLCLVMGKDGKSQIRHEAEEEEKQHQPGLTLAYWISSNWLEGLGRRYQGNAQNSLIFLLWWGFTADFLKVNHSMSYLLSMPDSSLSLSLFHIFSRDSSSFLHLN